MSPVSIVLPVYNGAQYLKETLESILNQTYQEFELIIINDGSKDESKNILDQYKNNSKITIIHQENMGLSKTLNKAISMAKYNLIARQDQDDISLPNRILKQVQFLDSNPDYGIVGSFAQILEENILVNRFLKHPIQDNDIKTFLIFDTPFVHSSVMFRKNVFEQAGQYLEDPLLQPPEDYELWSKMASITKMKNLDEILIQYRELNSSMSRTMSEKFKKNITIHNETFARNLGINSSYEIPYLFHYYFPFNTHLNFYSIFKQYFNIYQKLHPPFHFLTDKCFYWHLKYLFKKYFKMLLRN